MHSSVYFNVRVFLKPKTAEIKQLSILSQYCSNSEVPKAEFTKWSEELMQTLYQAYLGEKLPIDLLQKDSFQSKTHSHKYKKIRIKNAAYKCDGHGGDGKKLDIFF